MYKNLAIWAVVVFLGLVANERLIGKAHSGDRLWSDGAILSTYDIPPAMYCGLCRPVPRASAPKTNGVFADVELELWRMENNLFDQLQGIVEDVESFAKPISVE